MHCSQCNTELDSSMRFCVNCGTRIDHSGFGTDQNRRGQAAALASKTRSFDCKDSDHERAIDSLQNWLSSQQFDVQRLTTADGNYLIQASKRGEWRKLVGMSTATNIVLSQGNHKLVAEVGAGRWLDKAAGGLIASMVNPIFWVPAGFGALEQWQLPEKIFEFLESELGG